MQQRVCPAHCDGARMMLPLPGACEYIAWDSQSRCPSQTREDAVDSRQRRQRRLESITTVPDSGCDDSSTTIYQPPISLSSSNQLAEIVQGGAHRPPDRCKPSCVEDWAGSKRQRLAIKKGAKVYAVAFSPDGSLLAIGTDDKTCTAHVYRTSDWSCRRRIKAHRQYVKSVAFSSDGKLLALGSGDKTTSVYCTQEWRPVTPHGRPMQLHTDAVFCVNFSTCGKWLCTGSSDRTASLVSLEDWGVVRRLDALHTAAIVCVAFSPDSGMLALGSRDRTATVTSTATCSTVATLEGLHSWSICALAWAPDGSKLVLGSQDSSATVIDTNTWQPMHTIKGLHSDTISGISFSCDGCLIAFVSYDKTMTLVETSTWKSIFRFDKLHQVKATSRKINAVAISGCNKFIATGGDNGEAVVLCR